MLRARLWRLRVVEILIDITCSKRNFVPKKSLDIFKKKKNSMWKIEGQYLLWITGDLMFIRVGPYIYIVYITYVSLTHMLLFPLVHRYVFSLTQVILGSHKTKKNGYPKIISLYEWSQVRLTLPLFYLMSDKINV